MPNPYERLIEEDTLVRGMRARLELSGMTAQKLVEEHRKRTAQTLLDAGITMIPCEHLLDHQFVVSPGVYQAAKEMTGNA